MSDTVDILCSLFNGARHLREFAESLQRQTHADWRLWMRDDGSTDDTVAIALRLAETDPRMQLLADETPRRGVTGSFAWLLECAPSDVDYVMFADQDDVWLPDKIARTLAAIRAAEIEGATGVAQPVLVHTDLVVTDEMLNVVHPSFWRFAGMNPNAVSLNRLVVRNVVTGATAMLNRSLRELVGKIPPDAIFHDWWCACVAAALGRIVAVSEPTMLYRQHGANAVGARRWDVRLRDVPRLIGRGIESTDEFRRGVARTAAQAEALLARYAERLSPEDRRFLLTYSRIPARGFLRRKVDLLRFRTWPEQGVLRRLGVVLRG